LAVAAQAFVLAVAALLKAAQIAQAYVFLAAIPAHA
jgi:hypothetical protein